MYLALRFPVWGKFTQNSKAIAHIQRTGISGNRLFSSIQRDYLRCNGLRCNKIETRNHAFKTVPYQSTLFRILHTGKLFQNSAQSIKSGQKLKSKIPSSARMEFQRLLGIAKTEKLTLTGKTDLSKYKVFKRLSICSCTI